MRLLCSALLAATLTLPALAQSSADTQHYGFDALIGGPATQSSFTFDRSMLSLADSYFAGSDPEVRRVVAGLNSITVHNYHLRDDTDYNPNAWPMVEEGFRGNNWKHLVNANGKSGGSQTDLWMRFEGANIRNLVVLTRGRRDMNFIAIDCQLRPLDLLHLSGHFGIPKVDEGAVMVPAPR